MTGNVSIVSPPVPLRPAPSEHPTKTMATAPGTGHELDAKGAHIIAEAAKVFWTYGIKSMTMDDMSTRLGISKKTLYQHVKDKNDLVEKVLRHIADQFKCEVDESLAQGGNAIDELFALTNRVTSQLKGIHPAIHFDLEKYHPEAFRHMVVTKRKEIYDLTIANMERGIQEGLYRENLNIPMIATVYVARFDMVFDGELFPPDHFDMDALRWEILRYHVRGIASPKGLKYLAKKTRQEMEPAPPTHGTSTPS